MPDHDDWIAKTYPDEFTRLHALGVVNVRWNSCEAGLLYLFMAVAKLSPEEAWALAHDLGDVAISNRISTLIGIKKFDQGLVSAIANVLKVYDFCRQNRNQLTHFQVARWQDSFVLMRKSKKPDSMEPGVFACDLEDIRRVADQIAVLEDRLWILDAMTEEYDPTKPGPWPPQLAVPELLWKPPPQTHPPQPSRPRPA